jgi:co-chaperonin GroES (HSP10)
MARLVPQGPYILVKPLLVEEMDAVVASAKKAGLEIFKGMETKVAKAGVDRGTVVAVGRLAWKDWGDGSPWAKEGDVVEFAQYTGKHTAVDKSHGGETPEDKLLLLVKDEDVLAVLEE